MQFWLAQLLSFTTFSYFLIFQIALLLALLGIGHIARGFTSWCQLKPMFCDVETFQVAFPCCFEIIHHFQDSFAIFAKNILVI